LRVWSPAAIFNVTVSASLFITSAYLISTTFFFLVLPKKHALILTDINLLIIHIELVHDVTVGEQLQDLQRRRRTKDEEGHWQLWWRQSKYAGDGWWRRMHDIWCALEVSSPHHVGPQ
jgi:hypothetical protein